MNELDDLRERIEALSDYSAKLRKQVRAVDIDDDFDLLDYVNEIANQIDLLACGPRVASPPKRRNVVSTIAINVPH
jgi:hypothetical protein